MIASFDPGKSSFFLYKSLMYLSYVSYLACALFFCDLIKRNVTTWICVKLKLERSGDIHYIYFISFDNITTYIQVIKIGQNCHDGDHMLWCIPNANIRI